MGDDLIFQRLTFLSNYKEFKDNFNKLKRAIHDTAINKGWWEPNKSKTFTEQIMLAVCELAETIEEYRNRHDFDKVYYNPEDIEKPEGVPIEIADCIIRLLDTCEKHEIDIFNAIMIKCKYNLTRSYRHGNKLV